LWPYGWMD